MSDFKVGDRVRVVYEGVIESVHDFNDGFTLKTESGHTVFAGKAKHAVEVLERAAAKPYLRGTVAVSRLNDQIPAVRQADGTWSPSENWSRLTDAVVRDNEYFTVVHEPTD